MFDRRTRNVEGYGLFLLGDVEHPRRRHVEKDRIGVDETPDRPRAGDAINLGALARDPFAGSVVFKEFGKRRMNVIWLRHARAPSRQGTERDLDEKPSNRAPAMKPD